MAKSSNSPNKEIDLSNANPNAEISKLYVKLPSFRVAKNAAEAIAKEDAGLPAQNWFPESAISGYSLNSMDK